METEQAERLITDTLHKLFQFDGQQTQALETAKSDFQTMKKYIDQLETMYTDPKIEITGYKSGSILKSQEEEKINQTFGAINPQMKQADDSPMEMMLKKLEKHKQSNVDSVMMDDKQQKIEREIHADDSNLTVLQKEAAAHLKVYGDIRVVNDKLYNHKGLKKIDTIEVIDELTRDTASIDYVGGKYYVYENGQIVRELYAGGKKRLEEVSYIPEDKVGGAKPLDSFLAGTQYEFIEWVSPQGAVKKLAVRGGKRVVTDVAKQVTEKEIKGEVNKVASKGTGEIGWNMSKGGGQINGRKYSQHALERMAPDIPEVKATLTSRAIKKAEELGYKPQTKEFSDFIKKYVDPRNISPSVIEDAIMNTKKIPGNRSGTFVHETQDVKVIINEAGDVITVIPK